MSDSLTLAFVGDLCLGEEFVAFADSHGLNYLHPFETLKGLFSDVDLGMANLEGPTFPGSDLRPNVSVHLLNKPIVLDFLAQNNFTILSLANNHIMDLGLDGFERTLEMIKKAGLIPIGAGLNRTEASREIVFECKGRKIAFFSFTTGERNVGSIIADGDKPGCASFSDMNAVCERIETTRRVVDLVCVSIHWGFEYFQYPSSQQVDAAHSLVEAGANYVIGHHPHVIQGVERYKGSLIVYSLGNFFFPPVRACTGRLQYQKDMSKEVMVLKSNISPLNEIDYTIEGGVIKEDYTYALYGNESRRMFDSRMENLSRPLRENDYEIFWEKYKAAREKELKRESLVEAYKKFVALSARDKIKAISLTDIKRNLARLGNLLLNSK